jgi:hypothetical protein
MCILCTIHYTLFPLCVGAIEGSIILWLSNGKLSDQGQSLCGTCLLLLPQISYLISLTLIVHPSHPVCTTLACTRFSVQPPHMKYCSSDDLSFLAFHNIQQAANLKCSHHVLGVLRWQFFSSSPGRTCSIIILKVDPAPTTKAFCETRQVQKQCSRAVLMCSQVTSEEIADEVFLDTGSSLLLLMIMLCCGSLL